MSYKYNQLGAQFILSTSISTCFGRLLAHHQKKKTVFLRHLMFVIVYWWLSGMQEHMLLHTRQSSTQNNKYQVSQKHSCFSWWWAHSRPKHEEIDKYIKNKLCTKLGLFTRIYRDARSIKHTIFIQYHKKYKRFWIVMHGFKMLLFLKKMLH